MKKIIRITTVPISLGGLLQGQLHYMSNYFEVIGVSSSGNSINKTSELEKVGIKEKVRVVPVEMTRKITPIQDLKAVIQLYKLFKKERPDIVHSHTPKAGTLAMLAAKLAKVPNRLHTIAGLPLLEAVESKRKLLDIVEKITYSCATKIYPNSFGLKEIVLKNKFTHNKKLHIIAKGSSNGIDTLHFNPKIYSKEDKDQIRKNFNLQLTDFIFVFVGRLVKDKGINELIQAFKKVSVKNNRAKLLLVGSYERDLDPLLPEIEEEININPNIISVGWQNDVRPFFAISDVLTFPSYREGFPNVVMQAGAMELPCIVTDINGCNEIISENVNGIIIPPKDMEQLQFAMNRLINDQIFSSRLKSRARDIICERYERIKIWEALHKEYQLLLN